MFYGLAGLMGALLSLVFLVGYLPPYSWIADLQLRLMGTNFLAISFIVTFIVTSAPLAVAARWLEPRLDPDGRLSARWGRWDAFFDTWPGKLVLAGVTLAVMGGYLGYRDASRGPLVEMSARTIERQGAPDAAYVQVTGAQLISEASVSFRDGSSTHVFVPLVSDLGRERATIFARYRRGVSRSAALMGTLDVDGLPGEIRSAYEESDAITSPHWLLDVGADPIERASFAKWPVMLGCGLVAIALLWGFAKRNDEAPV